LAERAYKQRNLTEAEQFWREAIAHGEACLIQRTTDVDTRISLCWAYIEFHNRILSESPERQTEAESLLQKGLAQANVALEQRPRSGPARDVMASLNFNLAMCYCGTDRADQAIPLFQKSAATIESLCAEFPWTVDYWHTLQWFMSGTSNHLNKCGRPDAVRNSLNGFAKWLIQMHSSLAAKGARPEVLQETRACLLKELRAASLDQEADDIAKLGN
jgi:hypothetical protein